MRSVALLLPHCKPHSLEAYLAPLLSQAFTKLGIAMKTLRFDDRSLFDVLEKMKENPPLFTLSFSEGLSLQHSPHPHLYWEWRTLSEALHLAPLPQTTVAFSCRKSVARGNQLGWKFRFLPPAASFLPLNQKKERPYPVIFFDNLVDVKCLEKKWEELFPPSVCATLFSLVQEEKLPFEHDLPKEHLANLLFSAEEHRHASRIHTLVEAFEGVRLDLFGEHIGNNWLRRLKNGKEVHLHSSLPYAQPYTDFLEILHLSKILIRSHTHTPDGCDEWVFAALSCGCLPICSHTPYLEEILGKEAPLFTTSGQMVALTLEYLHGPKKREEMVEKLCAKVAPAHSIEKRVEEMVCG